MKGQILMSKNKNKNKKIDIDNKVKTALDEDNTSSEVSLEDVKNDGGKNGGDTASKELFDDVILDSSAAEDVNSSEPKKTVSHPKKKKSWKERTVVERLITLIPSVIMLAIFLICEFHMIKTQTPYEKEFIFSFAILAASVILGVLSVRLGKVFGWIVVSLAPAASFFLTEMFTHNPIGEVTGRLIFVNILLYYGVAVFVLFLTGSMKASVAAVTIPPMLYGAVNYYVLEFRGTPFFPWDIASAGIAADVVDNYEFIIPWKISFLLIAFIFIIQLGFLCTPRIRLNLWWLRAPVAVIAAIALVLGASYIQSDKGVSELKMYPYLFSPKTVYKKNGVAVTFLYTIQYAGLEKPEGYSEENLEAMLSDYESESLAEGETLPNVIVIMNEAFSDMKTAVKYAEKIPVTPYINSMSEDTIKGIAHVSVKGGNTANSEFEFLTGISMANMTPGSIPYQQHITGVTPTFVKQMNELGYKTVGMHPYGATGWNRDQVYEWFGFDETYFSADFKGYEKIRSYYSDAATYKKIIELYESKEEGQPLFVFDVTMQNHGGYGTKHENFTPQKFVAGFGATGVTNTYISLVNRSDAAFGELVEYFKTQDEPTVILMFGDHQPHDSVVRSLLNLYGVKTEVGSLDEQLERYTTPFVLWANYDIEEAEDVHTSINFLSSILCEKAGIPRTQTQMYLSALAEKYPVITEGHYRDSNGEYHSAMDMDSIREFVQYEMLSYNMIGDTKNTLASIYSYK